MQALKQFSSAVAPLDKANVDTDAIIPKQFLKSIKRSGFGKHLFYEWRYLLDQNNQVVEPNPSFVLNQAEYKEARILLTRDNFGCGSSREHAPWALNDYGFRVILAPSYADIFYNNCFKNGILPIVLPVDTINLLFKLSESQLLELAVDLEHQTITSSALTSSIEFDIESNRKNALLNGLDEIAQTLQLQEKIASFEQQYQKQYPWLFLAAGAQS